MTINVHLTEFGGKEIVDWDLGDPIQDAANKCYRIRLGWEASENGDDWATQFAEFLNTSGSRDVTAIVVGQWGFAFGEEGNSSRVVEALVTAYKRLPQLRALFIGDIISEENEISWIQQSDISPIFNAYPELEHFGVRGGNGLALGTLSHRHLKSLIVQTGGMDVRILYEINRAILPQLAHLELWLGTNGYGWDGTLGDVMPVLYGNLFPSLRYLGLRDSIIADEIAQEIVKSPMLERIETLDLSLGTLSDTGAAALIASPAIRKLKKLDIHHHYCSNEMIRQLHSLGIEVDTDDEQESRRYLEDTDGYRYVAVGE